MILDDRRHNADGCWGFVCFTDNFMSGWGKASRGRSLYCLAVRDHKEAEIVLDNGRNRSEMKRGRIQRNLPKLYPGDHCAVVDKRQAARWYEQGGFAAE